MTIEHTDGEQADIMQQLIQKTWVDDEFRQRLLADPMKTLTEEGAYFPSGLEIKAMENTAKVFHLVLPARPTHLSDLDLENIAAGNITSLEVPVVRFRGQPAGSTVNVQE